MFPQSMDDSCPQSFVGNSWGLICLGIQKFSDFEQCNIAHIPIVT